MSHPQFPDPPNRPFVLGHRGAPRVEPENTLAGYRAARRMGADGIELDVRRTADGRLAIHHDAHLPDGRAICDIEAADLPSSVPDLAAALDECPGFLVNIEIKNNPGDADFDPSDAVTEGVVAALAQRKVDGHDDWVLISSFNPVSLDVVRRLDPSLATAQLMGALEDAASTADAAARAGHLALHLWEPTIDAAVLAYAHDRGLRVTAWTVNDPERLRSLAALGADGVCTDVPDVALAAFRPAT
jgi:glycerophosphoryl diester phosphodiesterase